ncbi:hypothetical protein jhhlp_005299, partial [Lomentospora prolificans]
WPISAGNGDPIVPSAIRRISSLPSRKHHQSLPRARSAVPSALTYHSKMAVVETHAGAVGHDHAVEGFEPPRRGKDAAAPPLSVLPLTMVLRSLAISTISSSRLLLPPSLSIMSLLASSQNPILNPDKNPLLKYLIKKTFYAQFCAGVSHSEVERTINNLKDLGFSGVILGYAREIVLNDEQLSTLTSCDGLDVEECIRTEITPWKEGTLETVNLAKPGDFVALKFTGAGRLAMADLKAQSRPSPALASAIDSICTRAVSRGVRLLFDAEQAAIQPGIDDWTLSYMRKYNTEPGHAYIYGTYQAYLKSCPATLASHLKAAQEGSFTLGVKLVRGAYLGSDPRHLIHDTKADTDTCYDGLAESVLLRKWNGTLAGDGEFPSASLILASHNAESVRKAREICEQGVAKSEISFAQLMGMADEVSCELLAASSKKGLAAVPDRRGVQAYKYLVWGSTGECMKYLLRRAYENRDAVQRTKTGRDAMWGELVRRFKSAFGSA